MNILAETQVTNWIWIAASLAGLFVLAAGAMIWAKRRFGSSRAREDSEPFSLDQINRMLDQGQLTPEEYNVLKDRIIRQYSG